MVDNRDRVRGEVRETRRSRAPWTGNRALVLQEASYPPVHYLPLDDVEADVLRPSSHETYCSFQGDASYYSLVDGDTVIEDAVWSYLTPYDAVAEIADHVAFYPQHVEISAA